MQVAFVLSLAIARTLASSEPSEPQSRTAQVAIIGGGIGGAYTAYNLFQLDLKGSVDYNITVFERDTLGGRAREMEYEGKTYELGASMVYERNYYIRDMLTQLGLKRAEHPEGVGNLYNGQSIVFTSSQSFWVNLVQMIFRYQWPLFRFILWPLQTFSYFSNIYKLQDAGETFDTPEALLHKTGLYDFTQASFAGQLEAQVGRSSAAQRLSNEMVASCNRVNYNQHNAQLHGLVGLISTLPAVDNRVFAIEGGNSQLATRLMHHARANIVVGSSITTVTKTEAGHFHLEGHGSAQVEAGSTGKGGTGGTDFGTFDAVVIAAPLGSSGLEFKGVKLPDIPEQQYQRTVTTFLKGLIKPSYFNASGLSGAVFVTDDSDAPFTSIAPVNTYPDFFALYKIFSTQPLAQDVLDQVFSNYTVVAEHAWDAYPRYSPPQVFAPFRLDDGLYYNNAIEAAASAMEMSAIAGRNSALLVDSFLAGVRSAKDCGNDQRGGAAAAA